MARYGMAIDLDRCTGCEACVVACSAENNLPLGSEKEAREGRIIRWIKILKTIVGEYPRPKIQMAPMTCQHCDRPPCTYVCPVSATYKNPDGLVAQIYWRCIGCRFCVNACPYTIKFFNWWEPQFPEPIGNGWNPDVSVRTKGVTEKCTFCHHRLQKAKDKAREEGRKILPEDYVPACVQSCPAKAIVFGDLDDPHSGVSKVSESRREFKFLEELGTRPKISYLKEG